MRNSASRPGDGRNRTKRGRMETINRALVMWGEFVRECRRAPGNDAKEVEWGFVARSEQVWQLWKTVKLGRARRNQKERKGSLNYSAELLPGAVQQHVRPPSL
jgi:hypothetical protein